MDIPENPPIPPETPPPPKKNGLLHAMFSPEKRSGRVLRAILRWASALVGLFALGLFAAYFLLYRPLEKELALTQERLQTSETQLQAARTELSDTKQSLDAARKDMATAAARMAFYRLKDSVNQARLALEKSDTPALKVALEETARNLEGLSPGLKALDPAREELIRSRLSPQVLDATRAPLMLESDLEAAYRDLLDTERMLLEP